jgi:hypothetical protein
MSSAKPNSHIKNLCRKGNVGAYPGLFYAVLRSTVGVHGFFRRRNDGDAGSCDKS